MAAAGCRGGAADRGAAAGGDLHALVAAGRWGAASGSAALAFDQRPAAARIAAGGERRDAVVVAAGEWSWRLVVPPRGRLRGAVALLAPEGGYAGGGGAQGAYGGVQTTVTLAADGAEEVLEVIRLPAPAAAEPAGWTGLDLDLAAWSGRAVRLGFRSAEWGGDGGAPRLAWAPLRVDSRPPPDGGGAPPSILLIVADTLRRDRVSAYAGAEPTTPEIARLVAGPGLTFERAYAQAPWTAPSVASYLTGRYPERALARGGGIAAGVPTLAEVLRGRGHRTGAFVANPLLGGEGAYERGFETFFAAGVDDGWDGVRAGELTDRAAAWLAARRGEPFFLYVHYVDPHSPYSSPLEEPPAVDRAAATPDVDDLRWGLAELADPAADAARVAARYDAEVRYLDAAVGRLVEALPAAAREETLIVFTSDHGEELLDHGWWGHGRTLYEELIRVPLAMRWDGRLPAGGRVEEPVRLLDLVPTLAAAAGAPPPAGLDGVDLWTELAAGRAPPGLGAFAQHHYLGPRRAAAVRDGLKLILYDREAPAGDDHPLLDFAVALDRRLLAPVEAYDLASDPGERRNLVAGGAWRPELAALEDEIHRRLQGPLAGLRAIAGGLPAGSRLRARLRCTPAPAEVAPYFLDEGDEARVAGDELRLDLAAGAVAKGVVVGAGCARIDTVEVSLNGGGGAPLAVRAAATPWTGGPLERSALGASALWPPAAGGPALDLWFAEGTADHGAPRAGDESLERLQALGYVGR